MVEILILAVHFKIEKKNTLDPIFCNVNGCKLKFCFIINIFSPKNM